MLSSVASCWLSTSTTVGRSRATRAGRCWADSAAGSERVPTSRARTVSWSEDRIVNGYPRACPSGHRGYCGNLLRLFSGCGVNDRRNPRDLVCGKSTFFGVASDHLLVRSVVHAIDLVARDVALDPLNLRSHAAQHAARFLRNGLELSGRELAGAGNLTFDHELWHAIVLSTSGQGRM